MPTTVKEVPGFQVVANGNNIVTVNGPPTQYLVSNINPYPNDDLIVGNTYNISDNGTYPGGLVVELVNAPGGGMMTAVFQQQTADGGGSGDGGRGPMIRGKSSFPFGAAGPPAPPGFVEARIASTVPGRTLETPGAPDAVYTVQVGELGQHVAQSNVPILAVQWVIQGTVLKGYPMAVGAGAPVPLSPSDFTTNPVMFAWMEPGIFVVTCYITTAYGTSRVWNTFEVVAPVVQSFTATVGQTSVFDENDKQFLGLRSGDDAMGAGIVFNAQVQAGDDVSGNVAFLQIAVNERAFVDFEGESWVMDDNGVEVLDNGAAPASVLYAGQYWPIIATQTINPTTNDSPAQELNVPIQKMNIGVTPLVVEHYRMFVCFLPSTGGLWVPLAELDWYWGGYSAFDNETLEYSPATSTSAGSFDSGPPTSLPAWTSAVTQQQYVPVSTNLAARPRNPPRMRPLLAAPAAP
jgi:hypothetical protein